MKDLEFGVVLDYGGDQIIEDEADLDMKAQVKWEAELAGFGQRKSIPGKGPMINGLNGHMNGDVNGKIN